MHKFFYAFIIAFFMVSHFFSQESRIKQFRQLSRPEKLWIVFHPLIAPKVGRITQKAITVANEMKQDSLLDGDEQGGQVDAFRHSYWMALLAQHINTKKAYKLGLAHEKGNKIAFRKLKPEDGILPDSVSSLMDLENNKTGIEIGKNNTSLSEKGILLIVTQDILAGKMKIILKDAKGNYLDNQMKIIHIADYKDIWRIPKFLVNSNYIAEKEKNN